MVANASPVRENGQTVGYQSIRSRPSREEIEATAPIYADIAQGRGNDAIVHGRAVRNTPVWWQTLTSRAVQALVMTALTVAAAVIGVLYAPSVGLQVLTGQAGTYGVFFLLGPMRGAGADLERISDWAEHLLVTGDLTRPLDVHRNDRIGRLADRFDRFVSSVRATCQRLADVAKQVSATANAV